ncbi:MAG TPA: hypothetical protein VNS34_22455 [Rhizobiaceae bacterium]|nr:hypothetical protein [Rhizobiaceae bacterium]
MFRTFHPASAIETVENRLILQRAQDAHRLYDGLQVKVTHGQQFTGTSLMRHVAARLQDREL